MSGHDEWAQLMQSECACQDSSRIDKGHNMAIDNGNLGKALRAVSLVGALALIPAGALAQSTGSNAQDAGMYSPYKTPEAKAMFDYAFDPSPERDLGKVVRQMFLVMDRLSRYKIPRDMPNIYRVPHAELEQYVCGTHCSIKAWYRAGDGIYLDDSLKPETSVFDRSILLHELVHYIQDRAGEYGNMDDCDRWFHREVDAYNVQNRYLGVMGHPSRVAFTGDNCGTQKSASTPPAASPSQAYDGLRRQTGPEH